MVYVTLVTFFLSTLVGKGDMIQFEDFEMVTCPLKRNITIILDILEFRFPDKLMDRLDTLTKNEDCFTINVYLPSDGFVVQWRPTYNVNHFERNLVAYRNSKPKRIHPNDIVNLIKRLYNEELMGNSTIK